MLTRGRRRQRTRRENPIVVTNSGDPVATGLAASLAHPGGNVTSARSVFVGLSAATARLAQE